MASALAPLGEPRAPQRRPGRHLRPVERPARRRSPAVPALVGVGIVIAALLALAAMHAVLIGGQLRLDEMRREVAAESESIRRLHLQVAELESPDRMLETARTRLGMVQPSEVGYLAPIGVEVASDAPVRVEAATAPPPAAATEADDGDATGDSGADASADAQTRGRSVPADDAGAERDVAELAEGARDE